MRTIIPLVDSSRLQSEHRLDSEDAFFFFGVDRSSLNLLLLQATAVLVHPEKMSTRRARHWCFTINNPVTDKTGTADVKFISDTMDYIVVGHEIGKKGTPHLQCYVAFKRRLRFNQVRKLYPRARISKLYKYSTPLAAATYCKKDGDFVEYGTLPKSPARASSDSMKNRWRVALDDAKKGDYESIPPDMLTRYYHSYKRYAQDNPIRPKDLDRVCGVWYHGLSGAGKSHTARANYPDYYDKPLNKWWDGYGDEPHVILDDVDKETAKFIGSRLKRWSDKYSFPAEQKGTTVQIRPKTIIVTSQYTIAELWPYNLQTRTALERRFREVEIVRVPKEFKK